jgi:hypothetical protein
MIYKRHGLQPLQMVIKSEIEKLNIAPLEVGIREVEI